MEQLERNFNTKFRILVNLLVEKNKSDPEILKLRDGFESIKNHTPDQIIQASGPRLWKYREQIKDGNVEYFLCKDYSGETEGNETANKLIPRIKNLYYKETSDAEKALIVKTVKSLLAIYAEYMSLHA